MFYGVESCFLSCGRKSSGKLGSDRVFFLSLSFTCLMCDKVKVNYLWSVEVGGSRGSESVRGKGEKRR